MQAKVRKYRGWVLVETGHRYYSACRGSLRAVVGSIRHGDQEELFKRFKRVVDEIEGVRNGNRRKG